MYIMHIALQGCLRAGEIEYGITADTGGHIQYLLQLVRASAADPATDRIDIITRAFDCDFSDHDYRQPIEQLGEGITLYRLPTTESAYLDKQHLATELESFTAALNELIADNGRVPDFIHAHYADAAEVAAEIKARHGVPFVFTAHSLGRVKRAACATPGEDDSLTRRIRFEERALTNAALVLASSRDEAERQYADYDNYTPGRIRVLRPGIDAARFEGAHATPHVTAMLSRFLCEPDKPAILAIARPVARKNLGGLIRAFGESPTLRARANLVILAGNRERLDALEPEAGANIRELLTLIDDYDLHGSVAYPKHHGAADIPAIYAWARDCGGVFVNPAFNEPFGLTLLEAAAAGLPVVATDSGGPNDIVSYCRNGLLVSPRAPGSLATAIDSLLMDPERWQRCADNGRAAVRDYDWREHAARYHSLLTAWQNAPAPRAVDPGARLLVCDIDGTLIGCRDGLQRFIAWQTARPDVVFAVATGRSFHSALDVLEQAGIARPRCLITSVGSEIHHLGPDGITYEPDRAWQARCASGWRRDAIAARLAERDDIRPQSPLEQRPYKLGYFAADDAGIAERIRLDLAARGLAASVVHSHGRYVDVMPAGVAKGSAVSHLRRLWGLSAERVVVAGDSGNDIDMLRAVRCAIIVGNARPELVRCTDLAHAYRARAGYGQGVVEGVEHYLAADKARAS